MRRFLSFLQAQVSYFKTFRTECGAKPLSDLVQLSLEDFSRVGIIISTGTKTFCKGGFCPCGASFCFFHLSECCGGCRIRSGTSLKGWESLWKTLQNKRTPLVCTIHSLSTTPAASALWWTSRAARAIRRWMTRCPSWSGWNTAPARTPRARPVTAWASCCRSATSFSPRLPTS